jgi:centrosomal protein CEP104
MTKGSGGSAAGEGDAKGDEGTDFTTCMFCGARDKSWNEDALDLHYWKYCALLVSCPACAQVIEIADLSEHMLDECEQKDQYEPCEVTGLAIRKSELDAWQRSPNCKPTKAGCMHCPLCPESVQDTKEAWWNHLMLECSGNKRRIPRVK